MDILISRLDCIQEAIRQKTDEFKELVWTEGIPALVKGMKDSGVNQLFLRRAEDDGYFATEELWFWSAKGKFAAKSIKIDETGKLLVVYNTLYNQEESYESNWDYGMEDMECLVDRKISDGLISEILPTLLKEDKEFFHSDSTEDED